MDTQQYFSKTYQESRERFRGLLPQVKELWPDAALHTESIGNEEDLTIDFIYADARVSNDQVMFMTTGEHGIEGYAGAAVVKMFVENHSHAVDADYTGLCLVHSINPWGMKHFRRVTGNNVDLNRNYIYKTEHVPEDLNTNYRDASRLFQPNGSLKEIPREKTALYEYLTKGMAEQGYKAVKTAKGMGQYEFEKGVYYGGKEEERSASIMKSWQRKMLRNYSRVIHMDWHTALGPTNEVTMVISDHEERDVDTLRNDYHMENVEKFSPSKVKGDSTNHFYELQQHEFPDRRLLSALFEFGTFGTDREAELREFTTIILENELYWEGAEREEDRRWILQELRNMFYPVEQEWREAVLTEAEKVIVSVMKHENMMKDASAVSSIRKA